MPYATYSSRVNASPETVWNLVRDKIENPEHYGELPPNYQVLEKYSDGMLRQMEAMEIALEEKVVVDPQTRAIHHILVNNDFFTGKAINAVVPPATDSDELPIISCTVDWKPRNKKDAKKLDKEIQEKLPFAVRHFVLETKELIEQKSLQNGSSAKAIDAEEQTTNTLRLPGRATSLVKQLFSRGEAFDAEGFVTFFTDTPLYQFGNFEVCFDKAAIKKSANNFFSQINAVYHDIKMVWEVEDVVFVEMDVTYWRKDDSVVSLPCFDIFRLEGDRFSELRIFMDVNPVFDSSISVADNASVFTFAGEKGFQPPSIMKRFYTEEEGIKRLAAGFTPKWSAYKPKWLDSDRISTDCNNNNEQSQENNATMSEQLQAITKLSEYVLNQDWEQAKALLSDDILYRVGSAEPVYGKQAVVDFLSSLFKNQAQLIRHDVRQVFEEPDIISFEMDSKYIRNQDNHHLSIACCDIYRLEENRVKEWRVYADMSPFYEN